MQTGQMNEVLVNNKLEKDTLENNSSFLSYQLILKFDVIFDNILTLIEM